MRTATIKTNKPGNRLPDRAISSVVERIVHIDDVRGSNPLSPTIVFLSKLKELDEKERPHAWWGRFFCMVDVW